MCQERRCKICQHSMYHNEDFDAMYCGNCDEWKEDKCDDPKCCYCPGRPNKPSELGMK